MGNIINWLAPCPSLAETAIFSLRLNPSSLRHYVEVGNIYKGNLQHRWLKNVINKQHKKEICGHGFYLENTRKKFCFFVQEKCSHV